VESGVLAIPNLKTDIQSWINGSAPNFGWIITGTVNSPNRSVKIFYSRNHPEESYRPLLSVTYTLTENKSTLINGNSNIVKVRESSTKKETDINSALSLTLIPNPARNTLQIFAKGLEVNKVSTISVISSAGVIMRSLQVNSLNEQLDVSYLKSGVYFIKVISGDRIMYKRFVKL
jgi:hypothetical protein